ncbi:MAG: DoxX family protein [Saprospiraceae bacterium]|nr:DoxX family protein [Saprospiraceae bacterium]
MRDIADLIGRIFLSTIFIFEAFDSAIYMNKVRQTMEMHGLNGDQDWLIYGSIIFLFMGGLMVLLGYRITLGAFLLMCYWIPVTFITHDFWNHADGESWRQKSILFMHDIAIMGGLLMLVGKGSGRYSMKRLLATTRVR